MFNSHLREQLLSWGLSQKGEEKGEKWSFGYLLPCQYAHCEK